MGSFQIVTSLFKGMVNSQELFVQDLMVLLSRSKLPLIVGDAVQYLLGSVPLGEDSPNHSEVAIQMFVGLPFFA